jgi:phosphoribosylformylglycinamidine cyclo-ligase
MTSRYEEAGVSIDAGKKAVELMRLAVSATHTPQVLAGVGAFGGLFSLVGITDQISKPAIVASTDGVGTKVKIAAAMGRYRGIGHDIVNHCLNDIACAGEGVRPLLFLNYVASSKLDPEMVADIVTGMAEACQQAGCALLGGETAEMPGVYQPGQFDVVGTIVGVVDANLLFPRPTLGAGDVLLGLPSSGPHTNGFSLIRTILADTSYDTYVEGVGLLSEALLASHRCYLEPMARLLAAGVAVQSVAHITGGGLVENLPRAMPAGLTAAIQHDSWPLPPLFDYLQQTGAISTAEMRRVFNLGIGLVVVVKANQAAAALDVLGEGYPVGQVIVGDTVQFTL